MDKPKGNVLDLRFADFRGTSASDFSGSGNTGTLTGALFGDFEGSLDGFSLACGGLPTSAYVGGKIGQGLRLWSTGGDGLACAVKTNGKSEAAVAGYTIFFYSRGYTQASLFKLVVYTNSSTAPNVWICNRGNNIGEEHAAYYDFVTDGPVWVEGRMGKALEFEGVGDYVKISHKDTLNLLTNFTIELLAKPSNISQEPALLGKQEDGGTFATPYNLHILNSGQLRLFLRNTSNNQEIHTSIGDSLVTDEWSHITIALAGNTVQFYKNGLPI